MRTLVLCDDKHHPASLTREGLRGLDDVYNFEWLEDPKDWTAETFDGFPLVIFSKANNRSQMDETAWATEDIGLAFVDFVRKGGGIVFLHSGTALYDSVPSLCHLMGGIFTGHPPQCLVTIEPHEGHPMTEGVSSFTAKDEHYQMKMLDPEVDTFLSTRSEHGVQPGGWRRHEGEGRVCVLTPGHNLDIWHHPSYQAVLRHSLKWCTEDFNQGG